MQPLDGYNTHMTNQSLLNQSESAEAFLDQMLDDTSEEAMHKKQNEVAVEEALRRKKILQQESQRVKSRILFLTRKHDIFEKDSLTQKQFIALQSVFDELHVFVLGCARHQKKTLRVADRVWAYPVHFKYLSFVHFSVIQKARKELMFSDGFRPDLIVALDPFESGFSGLKLSKKFRRLLQIHVLEDFFTDQFLTEDQDNKKRRYLADYTLRRVASVRTITDNLRKKIMEEYNNIQDIALLPRYFHIREIIQEARQHVATKLFPQFSFVILYVGQLNSDSMLFRALDASRTLLQTPSIGFVVVGDGPLRPKLEERTHLLGIEKQVIFTPPKVEMIDYMRSADVLLMPDTTSESEEVVIKAAATGLPLIMSHTPLRDDLFVDGQDAFLCEPDDTIEFSQKLTKFLNTNALRVQFSKNGKEVVATRIEESPEMYNLAYRDTIESVLYMNEGM